MEWRTAITKVEPNHIHIRGYAIQDLIGKHSFGEVVYLLFQGEQLKGSKAVVIAMQQIRQVADANRERVRDMTQAMENLKFLADDLRELVRQFQLSRKNNKSATAESEQAFPL